MKYAISAIIIAVVCSFSFIGTKSIINGIVIDSITGIPIPMASLQVEDQSIVANTGKDGKFSFSVAGARVTIICSAMGYEAKKIILKHGQQFVKISLKSSGEVSNEIGVTGYSAAPLLQGSVVGIVSKNKVSGSSGLLIPKRDGGLDTEDYDKLQENRFKNAIDDPLSTFSIDVDGASYSNVRRFLTNGRLPPAGSVRIEELINYFQYNYPQPDSDKPFSINTEFGACPWNPKHQLLMIGLQGKRIETESHPSSNLVFLIDVSGSMDADNKLPLVKSSMKLLADQLRKQDRVAIVVYAGNAGLILAPTPGDQKQKIRDAIDNLEAGGSTAGGAGIQLAYKVAQDNFMKDGNNRVILCTDGDFNVGTSSDAELEELITKERESGIFLTVLGYGMGNYKDNKMQNLANKGNGSHSYIDRISEAKKVLVKEFGGTVFTIAKDVKLQIEFNPRKVQAYRLIGYENRLLDKQDFNNDKKDAGELGSGHSVTALYEVIPAGIKNEFSEGVDPLKYQTPVRTKDIADKEIVNIKFRYKEPLEKTSRLIEHPVQMHGNKAAQSSEKFSFAAAVAQFGMLLTHSEFKQGSSWDKVSALASISLENDKEGYRKEFVSLVQTANRLWNEQGDQSNVE